jgi:hypothetical protein
MRKLIGIAADNPHDGHREQRRRRLRTVIAVAFVLVTLAAWAEGPGTRLRTTPEIPQAMELTQPPAPSSQPMRCDGLRGEARERCLRQPREADAARRPSGPEATGMGSGAGAGATSGTAASTAGGAGFGGTAPR